MSGSGDARLQALVSGWLGSYPSPNTRAAYGGDFGAFRLWCDRNGSLPLSVGTEDLVRYLSACEAAGASSSTLARRASALDSFFRFACANDALDANPAAAMPRPEVTAARTTPRLDAADATALLRASDRVGPKAAALVRLLMLDGLKLGEVLAADASGFDARPAPALTVARRGRELAVPLHGATARRLDRYLGRRRRGPLLLSDTAGRADERLTRFGADYIVKKVSVAARLRAAVSANALRRRYVAAAIEAGHDVEEVRDRLGHRDARTAARYVDRPERDRPEPETRLDRRRR